MIKKMRGKANFDDLEKDLEFIDAKNIEITMMKGFLTIHLCLWL